MYRYIFTLALLLAALGCYSAGMSNHATALFVLGGLFEAGFWVRVFRGMSAGNS